MLHPQLNTNKQNVLRSNINQKFNLLYLVTNALCSHFSVVKQKYKPIAVSINNKICSVEEKKTNSHCSQSYNSSR